VYWPGLEASTCEPLDFSGSDPMENDGREKLKYYFYQK